MKFNIYENDEYKELRSLFTESTSAFFESLIYYGGRVRFDEFTDYLTYTDAIFYIEQSSRTEFTLSWLGESRKSFPPIIIKLENIYKRVVNEKSWKRTLEYLIKIGDDKFAITITYVDTGDYLVETKRL